ncbi:MAG: Na/Pi cotransporter family protein [Clostridiales bacterium]|nr:Na/Pi cotransporter family protein [Clostridiales bacterium]
MDIFDILSMIGGLCLFLFGMNVMGDSLERRAGNGLKSLLSKLTQSKPKGFLTGLGVTAVVQSSSATTVMVVGFVNSGIMTLKQAINVIMGANVGTTVTAWILSLSGISSDNMWVKLLKPTSFTPILALIGTIFVMFGKSSKKKDTGTILLGFATLMFGMDTMSGAVSGLKDVPQFQQLFILFKNPILGVLAGAVLTAIIQSSSASVGILQALSSTGQITNAAAIPIIMGQNIGTCATAMLSSMGTTKNAKRAAVVHLAFNVLGTVFCLIIFTLIANIAKPLILNEGATQLSIALSHTAFNVLCTAIMLPLSSFLEKIAIKLVPDAKKKEEFAELDPRLLTTPPIALQRCNDVLITMAETAMEGLDKSLDSLLNLDLTYAEEIRIAEDKTDHFEDILGTYLVKLNEMKTSDDDSITISKLLKLIGDYERISDHSVNIVESVEEVLEKGIQFTEQGKKELKVICSALSEIVHLAYESFTENDIKKAYAVEPLEQLIDELKDALRNNHITRLKAGECSIEAGFVWSDILTNLERVADHCENIALCIIDGEAMNMNAHEALRSLKKVNPNFEEQYNSFKQKYSI